MTVAFVCPQVVIEERLNCYYNKGAVEPVCATLTSFDYRYTLISYSLPHPLGKINSKNKKEKNTVFGLVLVRGKDIHCSRS